MMRIRRRSWCARLHCCRSFVGMLAPRHAAYADTRKHARARMATIVLLAGKCCRRGRERLGQGEASGWGASLA